MATEKPSVEELERKAEGIAADLCKHHEYGEALEWAVRVVNDRGDLQKWLLWTYGGIGADDVGVSQKPTDSEDLHACFCAVSAIVLDLSPGRVGIKSFPYRDWGHQIQDGLLGDPTHRAQAMGTWNEAKSTINRRIAQTKRARADKSRFFKDLDRRLGEYRPPEPVSCLADWSKRLEAWIAKDELPTDLIWMIFRPHREAQNATMSLSIEYPHIVWQIQDQLEFAEKWYERLSEGRSAGENLWQAIYDLNKRILTAVSVIRNAQAETNGSPSDVPRGRRRTRVTRPRGGMTQAVQDRFEFDRGRVLFDGNDLELPSGDPVAMLEKLVENFGRVVPYTGFDEHYSSATPGTVPKSKHLIVRSLVSHRVPCEITARRGEGYVMSESTPASSRKKRVRK